MNAHERAMRFGRLGIEPLPRGYGPPRYACVRVCFRHPARRMARSHPRYTSIAQSAARPRLQAKSRPIAKVVPCLACQRDADALPAVCVPGHRRRSIMTRQMAVAPRHDRQQDRH